MAEQRDGQERTERATPRRLEEARRQGHVARSRELTTTALLLAVGSAVVFAGDGLGRGLAATMHRLFSLPARDLLGDPSLPDLLREAMMASLVDLMPLLLLALILAVLVPMAVGGWVWSGETLSLKWERLDPIAGLRRMFGLRGFTELLKSLAKLALISVVLASLLWRSVDELMLLERMEARPGLMQALHLIGRCFLILAAATLIIALIDVPWQMGSHARRLRMSTQEIREELRETEGKPEIRARIRSLQQESARRRILEEVAKADVIVTDPAHCAVALRYQPQQMAAPRVVAKGIEEGAARILAVAARHKVNTFSAPALARAIYHSTKIGAEVPAGLHLAVARVLAYVFRRKADPGRTDLRAPSDLPIPEELRREA